MALPADWRERGRALDPGESFLVQAPAGSGKTELLIQRFLTLLAGVDEPEAVLAITFTRKAAGEMLERVLGALAKARTAPEPEQEHERITWRLGAAVLRRDRERGWQLEAHPRRLQIHTIDALCLAIARRMPLTSGLGAEPGILEDATELYREAARQTVLLCESAEGCADAIAALLRHLDNDWGKAERLLTEMLPRRDQWLRHIAGARHTNQAGLRSVLEANIAEVIARELADLRDAMPAGTEGELMRVACYAAGNLGVTELGERTEYPEADASDLPAWQTLAGLLLTSSGQRRSGFNVKSGFPAGSEREKQAMRAAVASLSDEAVERLRRSRELPAPVYTEQQWAVLCALFEVLPAAAAVLREVFRERRQVDFAELSRAAIAALGGEEAPSRLAYALDCRIAHILVDEFQDTSYTQWELLERLTAEWSEGDGRTLFCVGDPMQSIFGFREADVTLFLQAWRQGLPRVRLHPLQLTANFRSEAGLVEWNNSTFTSAFPRVADEVLGAVPLSRSSAVRPAAGDAPVEIHPFLCFPKENRKDEQEARSVVELVRAARSEDPDGSVAILFRARTHAPAIARALRSAGLRYQAVDINSLADSPDISDLLVLTRALTHRADRIAWLSLLRAPFCGLTLADLTAIGEADPRATVPSVLEQTEVQRALTPEGQTRLERLLQVIRPALRDGERLRLRDQVERVWCALGGPAALDSEAALEDVETFFSLLEQFDDAGSLGSAEALRERIEQLYSEPDPEADPHVQLLTMHKAKGLQFGTVIVPGLGRSLPGDSEKLLNWLEHSGTLLLAPICGPGEEKEPLSSFIGRVAARRSNYEEARLLYVAATRAERKLHLLGTARVKEDNGAYVLAEPECDSLLHHIWPVARMHFAERLQSELAARAEAQAEEALAAARPVLLRRVPVDWRPAAAPEMRVPAATAAAAEDNTAPAGFLWTGDLWRHAGTVLHAALERIAAEGAEHWDDARVAASEPRWRAGLTALGLAQADLEDAALRVRRAVAATLRDPRGRWILAAHAEAACELALSGEVAGLVQHVRIDRTFVDQGTRWIIDYKTATPAPREDIEAFLDAESGKYRRQLARYGELLGRLDERPIRVGLYFPLLSGWRDWSFDAALDAATASSR